MKPFRIRRLCAAALTALVALSVAMPHAAFADAAAVKGKTYRIATDTTFAPFEYRDANGELAGIDMDMIRLFDVSSG